MFQDDMLLQIDLLTYLLFSMIVGAIIIVVVRPSRLVVSSAFSMAVYK